MGQTIKQHTEQDPQTLTEGTLDTGYLSSVNGVLHVQAMKTVEDNEGKEKRVETPEEYGNFDIHARAVIRDDTTSTWDVRLFRKADGAPIDDLVPASVLADRRRTEAWLANHELTCGDPTGIKGRFQPGQRLMRYLIHQKPKPARIVQQLGYHDHLRMFITPQGVILPGEISFDTNLPYLPACKLDKTNPLPFTFGFAHRGLPEVREVLADVLSFHDETATALFASWSVMSLIQSSLMDYVDHFPVFAVEAPSGTGKTTGALGMLAQLLTGYTMGESQTTLPVTRDLIASTWSGFIHTDDLDDPKKLFELLRLSTAKGTSGKKVPGATGAFGSNGLIQLTGSMYITGEYLGMSAEKALLDRVVKIGLPSPVDRKSRREGREHVSQSRDLKEMQRRYPREWGGLAALSATVISEVLLYVDRLCELVDALRPSTGRSGDKYAVLLAGARMVDCLLGEDEAWNGEGMTSHRVQTWVSGELTTTSFDGDNKLTLKVIPEVLTLNLQQGDTFKGIKIEYPPCGFKRDGRTGETVMFFHGRLLPLVWEALKGSHNVDNRTESAHSLEGQADAMGFTKSVQININGVNRRVWTAPQEVTETLIQRVPDSTVYR
jgi:hypothetical protein